MFQHDHSVQHGFCLCSVFDGEWEVYIIIILIWHSMTTFFAAPLAKYPVGTARLLGKPVIWTKHQDTKETIGTMMRIRYGCITTFFSSY